MKERPILFSGPMVRAILEGRKTQTRRIVKWPVKSEMANGVRRIWPPGYIEKLLSACWTLGPNRKDAHPHDRVVCPYGQAGDRLWVREAFIRHASIAQLIGYCADGCEVMAFWMRKCPSIHMPRWASRLTLEIVSVRVERLQDISEADALAEGIVPIPHSQERGGPNHFSAHMDGYWLNAPTAAEAYRMLWESINGTGSWDVNPWVWVVEFKAVQP